MVSRVRNPTTDWHVVISDTAITLNQVNWLYFMFQYNYAHYTSRGGSKPFLAGFQPPKTILTIRPVLKVFHPHVFCLVSLNIKVILSHLSPRHLNVVLTRCDRAFLLIKSNSKYI